MTAGGFGRPFFHPLKEADGGNPSIIYIHYMKPQTVKHIRRSLNTIVCMGIMLHQEIEMHCPPFSKHRLAEMAQILYDIIENKCRQDP